MFYPAVDWSSSSSSSSSSSLCFINGTFLFSRLYRIEWQGDVNNELERTEKEAAVANFKVRFIILTFAGRNWKTVKKPRRNSQVPGSDMNSRPSNRNHIFRRVVVSRQKRLLASSLPSVRSLASNRLPLEGFVCKWSWSLFYENLPRKFKFG
jgi:hypothetical protein